MTRDVIGGLETDTEVIEMAKRLVQTRTIQYTKVSHQTSANLRHHETAKSSDKDPATSKLDTFDHIDFDTREDAF